MVIRYSSFREYYVDLCQATDASVVPPRLGPQHLMVRTGCIREVKIYVNVRTGFVLCALLLSLPCL